MAEKKQDAEKPEYSDGTKVRLDHIDATTAASSAGMNPATGEGNGDPNADPTTAANAPEFYSGETKERPKK